jgi:carbonyl reductase 1
MGRLVGSGKTQPPKTPEEGARIPVRLAFDDLGGVSGKYWANSSVRGKGEGEVQGW